MSNLIKSEIATLVLIALNNIGLMLTINFSGYLKIMGYIGYFITFFITWFIAYHYMNSDYYKNLGKEQSTGDKK